ncbi:aminodeoxychorismate lyase [Rhodanobacter sp. OK091]|uniref:aminodeoxychorismate lyase n=1 Tax=Rhodanobacter sp. OK091 TaxID=1881037 RepID=UPI0009151A14|nr:aminodeoxychorismate lyase [Rhodanobacter sp. OK091]SHM10423.1 aminodeoxychorismate lyase apoprotein [Rhodanobacter sp. OK091]
MAVRMLINGVAADQVPALDRGLAYGDGLFESIRLVDAVAPLWSRHMRRLVESCGRLRIPPPDTMQLWSEVLEVTRDMPHSVVRITVTRGIGERGYALPAAPQPMRVVAAFAPPQVADSAYAQGVRMRVCDIRLAEQPLLAGMKHLNRLEQVLARAEWSDPAIAEGVLCDSHGRVISATMANLFAVVDGMLLTPALDRCGVAGVARAEVLAACPQTQVGALTLDALLGASEVFLSSSVRGILPVRSLDKQDYPVGGTTRQLQQHWRDLGLRWSRADE